MTTNKMITELRDMAKQCLTPDNPGTKFFNEVADRLEQAVELYPHTASLLRAADCMVLSLQPKREPEAVESSLVLLKAEVRKTQEVLEDLKNNTGEL